MLSGFDTAFGEITLVLFTTLAPSGVVAYLLMGLPLVRGGLAEDVRRRINQCISIPLIITMVGLVASATHLGSPSNALYVFLGVGRSPLSTEVFSAVVFLALAGVYWLYSFSEHVHVGLQRIWMAFSMVAGVAFVMAIAFAYAAETISSWNTVYVPLNIWFNALVGGPILAILGLRVARWEPIKDRFGGWLIGLALVALVCNTISFGIQGAQLPQIQNAFLSAADLVPYYGLMVAAFCVLGLAGIAVDAWAFFGQVSVTVPRAIFASIPVLTGIFIMRFAFYMMHMTVGLGV